jgi:hypothetical protein
MTNSNTVENISQGARNIKTHLLRVMQSYSVDLEATPIKVKKEPCGPAGKLATLASRINNTIGKRLRYDAIPEPIQY